LKVSFAFVFSSLDCTFSSGILVMIGLLLYRNRAIANVFSQSLGMAIRVMVFTALGIGALRYAFPDMTSLCLSAYE
jgi:hypothetical protein